MNIPTKRIKIYREVGATPMTQADAEAYLGREITNTTRDSEGTLVTEQPGGDTWVPSSFARYQFHPYDTDADILRFLAEAAIEHRDWIARYLARGNAPAGTRRRLESCARHLDAAAGIAADIASAIKPKKWRNSSTARPTPLA